MKTNTITLDRDLPAVGLQKGTVISFDAEMRTIDDGLAFYISQLSQVESRIYEAKYLNINFADLIPIDTSMPEWVDSVDYISIDAVTMGKFIGAAADDLPNVSANAHKSSIKVGYAGNSFEYTLDELRKSAQMRMPIDVSLARAARRGAEEHMQEVAYFGDADRGMTGLFNNPNVSLDNSTLDWNDPATTPLEIVADVNDFLTSVWATSSNIHVPNTLVLPSERWSFLATTTASTVNPDVTIMDLLMKNNVYTKMTGQQLRVVPRLQLSATELAKYDAAITKDRMMAYENNSENLVMHVPMVWRPIAPQARNLKIKVPAEYKVSGVEFRYPLSGAYRTLI